LELNEVARDYKVSVEQFKDYLAVLISLRDPALTEKPWEEIRSLLQCESDKKPPFHDLKDPMYTLGWIKRNGIAEFKE